jgi:Flp pilus assembly protein CpaB
VVAQDAGERPALETQVDDTHLVAGGNQRRGDVLQAQRLGLEEWRQSELDSGWPGLD